MAIAILSMTLFSAPLMHHQDSMMDSLSCVDHCVSAMQNFSQSLPAGAGIKLFLLSAFALFLGLLSGLFQKVLVDHKLPKSRLRQLYQKSLAAFSRQLGRWLILRYVF